MYAASGNDRPVGALGLAMVMIGTLARIYHSQTSLFDRPHKPVRHANSAGKRQEPMFMNAADDLTEQKTKSLQEFDPKWALPLSLPVLIALMIALIPHP